ncbi:MAG: F0F1 ATP synthase subunit gamma [Methylovulum sp.]
MSQSRELQLHIAQMEEIRTILNSMKNLALIEIHKLGRFQSMQSQAVANIENAALDFLNFFPVLPIINDNTPHFVILIGAERGFCGDFNESLINAVTPKAYAGIIAVGSRLAGKLGDNPLQIITAIEGANVAEEIPNVLNRLIDAIALLQKKHDTLALIVIHHENQANPIAQRQLLPPFPEQQQKTLRYANPPLLNLNHQQFFSGLLDHYLFAALHEIFYVSLMNENQRRLQHLEGAIKHLDDETVELRRKSQIYRQEEITQEIEVILLNTENL